METDTKMSVSVLDPFVCAGVIMTFLPSQIKATLEEGTYSCFSFQCSLQLGAVSWQQRSLLLLICFPDSVGKPSSTS